MKRITLFFLLSILYLSASSKVYCLVIGISDYEDYKSDMYYYGDNAIRYNLQNAFKDASLFSSYLSNKYKNDGKVITLFNKIATLKNIYSTIDTLLSKSTENDQIILYLSGHGTPEYFATYNIEDPTKRLYYGDIIRRLNGIKAKLKFYIIDSCYSGNFWSEDKTQKTQGLNRKKTSNTVVITSTESDKIALDYFKKESYFNFTESFCIYLKKGLEGEADENKDHSVTLNELYSYLKQNVTKITNNKQIPQLFGDFDGKNIEICKY